MSFQISLSGLNAASSFLNVTANNIANVNTTGFKRSRANFVELFASGLQSMGASATGLGTRMSSVQQLFTQGNFTPTGNNLDLAISGDGFFVLNDNGATTYTRAGAFGVDRNGFVVNDSGQRLQVFPPLGDGFNTGQMQDLQLVTSDSPPQATGQITLGLNLPANADEPTVTPFDPDDPESFNHTRAVTVFDSLGASHSASYYFVKTANPNEWEVHLFIDGDQVGSPETLEFDGTGTLVQPADGDIDFGVWNPPNDANPLEFTSAFGNSTQYGERFAVNNLVQDGFTSGRLIDVDISEEGVAFARFTNGQSTALGKVAMANFASPQNLQKLSDTQWAATFSSGDAILGEAGSSSLGLIESGMLEDANVNLTEELIDMITAQRNFQANSQMISTADQITQTILNIR
jgi:flagellar hook protein FlgE